ncbi:MAG: esterase [Actinobacteria bacterium]|nr:MAG: esterase [Actinomycetota bacterium]
MRGRLRLALGSLAAVLLSAAVGVTAFTPSASAATLTEVTNFGPNPGNLRMHLYVPDRLAPRPPILVAIHYCTGSGPAFYSGTQFASLADRYGYIVIYPSVTRDGQCFDVYSPQALRRDGGSDPVSIMSMVRYVQQRYNADPNRIFATGLSSGAMMTNVLLGNYPDVFAAGAAFAGVPHSCFATGGTSTWNSDCANGRVIKTPQEWGDLVRAAYPGYTGRYPRMQIWHGTEDEILRYPNFNEQIKQWTNLHGLSQTPTYTDSPQPGYTRTRYGGSGPMAPVEAISMQGVSHNLPVNAAEVIRFFGLDNPTATPPSTPSSTPPVTPPTTPPTATPPPLTPTPITPSITPSGVCSVTTSVNSWNTGYVATIRVTAGSTGVNGWRVEITLLGQETLISAWNAQPSGTSGTIQFTNMSYNGRLAPGQSTEFGFQALGQYRGLGFRCIAS